MANAWPMCINDEESVDHLLLKCWVAQELWNSVFSWFGCCWVLPNSLVDHFVEWKVPLRTSREKEMWQSSFVAILLLVWKESNLRCFEGNARNADAPVDSLKFMVASWMSFLPSFQGFSTNQILLNWRTVAFT